LNWVEQNPQHTVSFVLTESPVTPFLRKGGAGVSVLGFFERIYGAILMRFPHGGQNTIALSVIPSRESGNDGEKIPIFFEQNDKQDNEEFPVVRGKKNLAVWKRDARGFIAS
jgi:hypothetical protein